MLARLTAAWLVVLITAPFTAPFSTCDLASMLHDTAGRLPVSSAAAQRLAPTAVAHGHSFVGLRLGRRHESDDQGDHGSPVTVSRETAIPGVVLARAGSRGRLQQLTPVFAPSGAALVARPSRLSSSFEQGSVQECHTVPGVLRL